MGFVRNRTRGGRAESLQRSLNSTRIPLSLRKELADLENSIAGYDSAESSSGKSELDAFHCMPRAAPHTSHAWAVHASIGDCVAHVLQERIWHRRPTPSQRNAPSCREKSGENSCARSNVSRKRSIKS